jgi:hypothetical protein
MKICMKCKAEECKCQTNGFVINEAVHTVQSISVTVPKCLTLSVEVNGRAKIQMSGMGIETDKPGLIRVLRDIQQACQIVIGKIE